MGAGEGDSTAASMPAVHHRDHAPSPVSADVVASADAELHDPSLPTRDLRRGAELLLRLAPGPADATGTEPGGEAHG